jgi:hypothetical protein
LGTEICFDAYELESARKLAARKEQANYDAGREYKRIDAKPSDEDRFPGDWTEGGKYARPLRDGDDQ